MDFAVDSGGDVAMERGWWRRLEGQVCVCFDLNENVKIKYWYGKQV